MSDAVSSGTLTPAPCQKLSIVGKVLRLVNFTKREIDWQKSVPSGSGLSDLLCVI